MRDLKQAADLLRKGGLVAFPTETVYGLGADARSTAAVMKIFRAKGRPATNPLIVHVTDASVARRYVDWNDRAEALAEQFWPGPLTLVLPRGDGLAAEVSAGLSSAGVRSPDHPMALALLRAFDGPVAAPSANRSTHISPTTAEHVRAGLGDWVDLILDGGPCRVGIESTVLDLAGDEATILRPGGVSRDKIEAIIGEVRLGATHTSEHAAQRSPGQQKIHYAPRTACFWFSPEERAEVKNWVQDRRTIWLARDGQPNQPGAGECILPDDPVAYATRLYAALHECDVMSMDLILIELPPDESEWSAVRDRLTRAARYWREEART